MSWHADGIPSVPHVRSKVVLVLAISSGTGLSDRSAKSGDKQYTVSERGGKKNLVVSIPTGNM